MKEFIEKLIGRLEEEIEYDPFDHYKEEPLINMSFEKLEDIVNQLAEEYNNGWIPCSEDKPKENGWYECWYMVSAVGENKEYEPITLYWEENIWLYRPNRFTMPTQRDVVAWKQIAPYQPKGE